MPKLPRFRRIGQEGRLWAFRPLKPLPRRLGIRAVDASLRAQVSLVARALGFRQPTLWLNDVTYAPLIRSTGWSTLYDVTDDWLVAPFQQAERDRLRALHRLAMVHSDEVVVCSRTLLSAVGPNRRARLIPNGVDAEHFRRPRERPEDLPQSPVAVYVGTLHESRLDVDLVDRLAHEARPLKIVLVGPDALNRTSRRQLVENKNVHLLGQRPYQDIPAYLQHADVVIVPHVVSAFTDSLDPIKAYECSVIDTPTVATPVAGFREHPECFKVVEGRLFPEHVVAAARGPRPTRECSGTASWEGRLQDFEMALREARSGRPSAVGAQPA